MNPFYISFGKAVGAKKAPRWAWKCDCDKCSQRALNEIIHGPFKTLRAAEKDAEQAMMLIASEAQGTA